MTDQLKPTITAYFLGGWPGHGSCRVYKPGGRSPDYEAPETPWFGIRANEVERARAMRTCWEPEREGYPEGQARFTRQDGWTLIGLWDRSGEDNRRNVSSVFAIHSDLTDDEALGLARRLFPEVFERIEARVGHEVRLAPAACPLCRQSLEGADDATSSD